VCHPQSGVQDMFVRDGRPLLTILQVPWPSKAVANCDATNMDGHHPIEVNVIPRNGQHENL
jgi:hypothetical protein